MLDCQWWPDYAYSTNSFIFLYFFSKTSLSMASKPPDILKKGLRNSRFHSKLKKNISKPNYPGRNPFHHWMLSKHVKISKSMAWWCRWRSWHWASADTCKVLKSVSTINKHIDGLDDPVSRKIEGLLWSFNWQLCLNETKTMKILF